MKDDSERDTRPELDSPMLWGFLSTLLLGITGYFGLFVGAWPLLWLPVLAPVFAFVYMRSRFRNDAGFGRFLVGYGICLVLFVILIIAFIEAAV
jgi:hypothetical protein